MKGPENIGQPTRVERYAAELRRGRAEAMVLTSPPAVQHACGVRLFTQRLIPMREVVCVLTAAGESHLVCCVLELDQLAVEHPELQLHGFAEFGEDPWAIVAEVTGGGPVQVEPSMPVAWERALAARLGAGALIVSEAIPARLRAQKDAAEQELFEQACAVAERAIAAGAAAVLPGESELGVSEIIEAAFTAGIGARVDEVSGIVVSPQANRSMHHVPTAARFPADGPVRIGVMGRVDGYWVLLTRMLLLGENAGFEDEYRRYLEVYESVMEELRPGRSADAVYRECRERAAASGFELTTLKIAHSTGLDFREDPCVAPGVQATLEAGMILAYDYGLEGEDGTVLHIEDRVAVTATGPRRISAGWDLGDLRGGFSDLISDRPVQP